MEAEVHLRIAFTAFCKRNRSEDLTVAEEEALKYCDKQSLYYIQPAIFRIKRPYRSYSRYDFCPPDILHTILGGYLKDFIFNTCVIVSELKTLQGGRYKSNLAILNELVRNFPVNQGAGYNLKRFPEGVTPYVVNKNGPKKSKRRYSHILILHIDLHILTYTHTVLLSDEITTNNSNLVGLSTSGLGGLSLQDVPDLVLQVLFCIGNEGAVIPKDLSLPISIDPVVVVVLRCGYKALNYYYNLKRSTLTINQIDQLNAEVKSLNFDYLLLYRMKQLLLRIQKNHTGKNLYVY